MKNRKGQINGGSHKSEIVRIAGKLKELVTFHDEKGKPVHRTVSSVMFEFYPRDLMQVIVGASILAVPVAFTEEVWNLGLSLGWGNIIALLFVSLGFIGSFVYYNFYRGPHFDRHKGQFVKRVLLTYGMSFVVVTLLLTIIGQAPWAVDLGLVIKRSIIVSFPASMSAAVSDSLK